MDQSRITALIDSANAVVQANREHWTSLDQAIGDGDHGINMARGFAAIGEDKDAIAAKPLGDALQTAGMALVMKVGGASGPLYGSFLMALGKAAPDGLVDRATLSAMLDAGIEAVKKRGKSDRGAKTMLDVLIPVRDAVASGADAAGVRAAADAALEATRDMQATKGRASFLGERSIGHLDPGAASTCQLVHVVCDLVAETVA